MDIAIRRRAVYTGLRPFFDDKTLLPIMDLWQDKYATKPKFAFSGFLAEACQSKAHRAQRTDILASLFKAMDLPESDLLPDPWDDLVDSSDYMPETVEEADRITLIFQQFVTHLLQQLSAVDAQKTVSYILTRLTKLNMNEQRRVYLREWLENRTNVLSIQFDPPLLRQLVNMTYVAMCEYIGPVKADQILAKAIRELEPNAQAQSVNVYDFL